VTLNANGRNHYDRCLVGTMRNEAQSKLLMTESTLTDLESVVGIRPMRSFERLWFEF
jgi:hypothetical protein